MQYLILGPLEVRAEAGNLAIPAAKQRALLTILLVHHGSPVPGWRLIEDLWQDPPVSARKVVQTYVSKLRHILPAGTLVTTQTGYRLNVGREELDSARFEDLLRAAESAPHDQEAALLREALGLWRGGALEDFVDEPFAQAEIARLEAIRMAALERRLDLDLAQGRHDSLLAELAPLVQDEPAQRTNARTADARPVPVRPAGRRPARLPGGSPRPHRATGRGAHAGAAQA